MGCCLNTKKKLISRVSQRSSASKAKLASMLESNFSEKVKEVITAKPSKRASKRFISGFVAGQTRIERQATSKILINSNDPMSAVVKRRKSVFTSDVNLPILEVTEPLLKISEATHPTLISRSFLAKTLKYEQWLPVCTIPGEKVFCFVEGRWRINEDKGETNFKGYLEEEDGLRLGSLQVKALGSDKLISINTQEGVEFEEEHCILVRIHMGSNLKYVPMGELTVKLVGCQDKSLKSVLPSYKQISTYIQMFEDLELDEEERQLFYFVESLRTFKGSFMEKYLNLEFKAAGSLDLCPKLMKMTEDFIQPAVNEDVNANMLDLFRERFRIAGRIESIVKKFNFDHYSAHLKAAELLSSSTQILLNPVFSKIGIRFKRAPRESVIVLLLLN